MFISLLSDMDHARETSEETQSAQKKYTISNINDTDGNLSSLPREYNSKKKLVEMIHSVASKQGISLHQGQTKTRIAHGLKTTYVLIH